MSYAPTPQPMSSYSPNLAPAVPQMQYFRSFNYAFENPNVWSNLFMCGLAILSTALIPILGQLVALGYTVEILQSLMATNGTRYCDFDFNRFSEYLNKSIWPFVVQFVATIIFIPIFYILLLAGMFGTIAIAAAAGEDVGPIVMAILFPLLFVVVFAAGLAFGLFLNPLLLRAMISQDFSTAFDIGWCRNYVSVMLKELVLSGLFTMVAAFGLALLAVVTCGIGIIVIAPLIMFSQIHLNYQQYTIYLARGGKPIPVKQLPTPPQPPMSTQNPFAENPMPPKPFA